MEFASRRVHFMALVDPLVVAALRVKRALLETAQFQGETRAHFLHVHFLAVFYKFVAVHAEEYVVALVIKSNHLSASKLRLVWIHTSKHPAYSMPKTRSKSFQK